VTNVNNVKNVNLILKNVRNAHWIDALIMMRSVLNVMNAMILLV
jgi:hypothetical protein